MFPPSQPGNSYFVGGLKRIKDTKIFYTSVVVDSCHVGKEFAFLSSIYVEHTDKEPLLRENFIATALVCRPILTVAKIQS